MNKVEGPWCVFFFVTEREWFSKSCAKKLTQWIGKTLVEVVLNYFCSLTGNNCLVILGELSSVASGWLANLNHLKANM